MALPFEPLPTRAAHSVSDGMISATKAAFLPTLCFAPPYLFSCNFYIYLFMLFFMTSPLYPRSSNERRTAAFEETEGKMITTTDPNRMTPDQRLDEIAAILASGVLRLRLKRAQHSGNPENLSLDNGNRVSPYVTVRNAREGGTEP
ncbi:MAG: hypothetical protein HQL56_19355 [Magnetococcales bacterium]|nr:hypothetical protein [Magnetococcales bacterium]